MTTASISVAFRVFSQEEDALIEGRSLTIMPPRFMRFGQQFALYPDRPDQSSETVLIRAWARCELCQNLYESLSLDVLAQLLNLSSEELHEILEIRFQNLLPRAIKLITLLSHRLTKKSPPQCNRCTGHLLT